MTPGIPGFGLGGLFFIISALLAPVFEIVRTVRGRSSLARWQVVGYQAAIAASIAVVATTAMLAALRADPARDIRGHPEHRRSNGRRRDGSDGSGASAARGSASPDHAPLPDLRALPRRSAKSDLSPPEARRDPSTEDEKDPLGCGAQEQLHTQNRPENHRSGARVPRFGLEGSGVQVGLLCLRLDLSLRLLAEAYELGLGLDVVA
jgi:hypothetical protein